LESDALDHVLRTFFGNEARLYIGQGIILDPGKGRGVWPRCWHADMFQIGEAIGDPAFCFGINCLVIVDDMNEANGPTCLLAGSQSLRQLGTESEEDLAGVEVRTVAPAGSLLLIGASTWHSAGQNNSVEPRRVIKLLFTRQWIRPQIDYAAVISRDVVGRLGPRARRLLGLP
jgi:ectoine hydroxylase-related dioxygenase (phytanoyl-CoA dioxygenase family)